MQVLSSVLALALAFQKTLGIVGVFRTYHFVLLVVLRDSITTSNTLYSVAEPSDVDTTTKLSPNRGASLRMSESFRGGA